MIKNVNYTDKDILDEELLKVFHKGWFYVGLTDKLKENNNYITYKCGNVALFVQNFNGKLKSFSNICLHRFNSIHKKEEGNGHLICSYHSWIYDEEGRSMINSGCLKKELNSCERNELERYELDTCGRFVFVKVNKNNKISLKQQLSSFYDKLLDLSSHFDQIINDELVTLDNRANWKLLVENVLECYHCSSVHKETLVPMGIGSKKPENHEYDNANDKIDYPMRITSSQKEREEKLTFLNKTQYFHKSLQHWFIYPNLFITSTAGNLFYIGKLTPCSVNQTQLKVNFMLPTYNELSKKEAILLKAYASTSLDSAIKVIFEDREILEQIQNNLEVIPSKHQVFGEEEFRIQEFHKKLKSIINYK